MRNLPNDDSLLEFEGLLLTSANLAKSLVASWLPSAPNSIGGKTDSNGVELENSRIGKTTGISALCLNYTLGEYRFRIRWSKKAQ